MLFMISLELQHEIDSIIFTDDEEKKAYCRYKIINPDGTLVEFRSKRKKLNLVKTPHRPSFFTDGSVTFQPPSIEDTISYMKEMNSLR